MRGLLFLLLLASFPLHALENRLAGNPSPYLAMHGGDPVHWQPWSAEVLELAKREGRLIFISSGYFSCHWCHVMQRESYRNPEIARILNDHFIPVKVDRELDPALDEHLIDFVQRTRGRAGWPLNVFLTPEGYPVAGMTYVPPGKFKTVLERLYGLWDRERDELTGLARNALEALEEARRGGASTEVVLSDARLASNFVDQAMKLADELSGGFGQQSRFPMTPQLAVLLKLQAEYPREQVAEFLQLTLAQMASQGLRDHLGGGFFRYTVDPHWHTPHFEKMLYTQALLALLYLDAARVLQNPVYGFVARDTLDFVTREMAGRGGGYVASFSAVDDEGVEGGYYLWTMEQLKRLLAPGELELALRHWKFTRLSGDGDGLLPLQGETVSVLAKELGTSLEAMEERVARVKKKLLEARKQRVLPVDHKQLAGWNGLLLAALSRAAGEAGGERFGDPARRLKAYLLRNHWKDGVLLRTPQVGGGTAASLQDYAYVAWGLSEWARLEGDEATGRVVRELLSVAWRDFHDDRGWRSGSRALLPGMPAMEAQEDGAMPAPSAVVLRLSLESGDELLASKAKKALFGVRRPVQVEPFWYASHLPLLMKSSATPQAGTVGK